MISCISMSASDGLFCAGSPMLHQCFQQAHPKLGVAYLAVWNGEGCSARWPAVCLHSHCDEMDARRRYGYHGPKRDWTQPIGHVPRLSGSHVSDLVVFPCLNGRAFPYLLTSGALVC